jgi:hypothetical protein
MVEAKLEVIVSQAADISSQETKARRKRSRKIREGSFAMHTPQCPGKRPQDRKHPPSKKLLIRRQYVMKKIEF